MLGLGDQEVANIAAWESSTGVTFPLLLQQDTYSTIASPGAGPYSLEVLVDKQGVIRHVSRGGSDDIIAMFPGLLAE